MLFALFFQAVCDSRVWGHKSTIGNTNCTSTVLNEQPISALTYRTVAFSTGSFLSKGNACFGSQHNPFTPYCVLLAALVSSCTCLLTLSGFRRRDALPSCSWLRFPLEQQCLGHSWYPVYAYVDKCVCMCLCVCRYTCVCVHVGDRG